MPSSCTKCQLNDILSVQSNSCMLFKPHHPIVFRMRNIQILCIVNLKLVYDKYLYSELQSHKTKHILMYKTPRYFRVRFYVCDLLYLFILYLFIIYIFVCLFKFLVNMNLIPLVKYQSRCKIVDVGDSK